jgi:two-component system response regulator HydG
VILCEGKEIAPADLNLNQSQQLFSQETLTLEEMEKRMIVKELKNDNHNLSVAAKNLGISRTTLYKKLQKYGL